MEDCNICYSNISTVSEQITLSCQHSMCKNCYLHLTKSICPYCRKQFDYSLKDNIKRQELNIDNNYTHPPQLFDTSIHLLNSNFNQLDISNNTRLNNYHIPFSRRERHKIRRRRRDLTESEIKERRKIIRNKCKRKWLLKKGRLNKLKWFEVIL
uniref:RING-type domain-containing protein n=1 Tax=viral metagenome TaxID=1070528 RepID=A0A6C0J3F4_9ZZZZ